MNGPSKCVQSDCRNSMVVASYAHAWIGGSVAHAVPSIHRGGKLPVFGGGTLDPSPAPGPDFEPSPEGGASAGLSPPGFWPCIDGPELEHAAKSEAAARRVGERIRMVPRGGRFAKWQQEKPARTSKKRG
jgi:hypothetical protein